MTNRCKDKLFEEKIDQITGKFHLKVDDYIFSIRNMLFNSDLPSILSQSLIHLSLKSEL